MESDAICDILRIDPEVYRNQFDVKIDNKAPDNPLRLVHYKEDANLRDPQVAALRGVIIDTHKAMLLAATSYRSTLSNSNFLDISEDGHTLRLATEFGQRELAIERVKISQFTEGFGIRIYRHDGKTHFSSNQTLNIRGRPNFNEAGDRIHPNAGASRWAPHLLPFYVALDGLLQISEDEYDTTDALFPVGCDYSPFVYVFYVTHASRLQDTLMSINDFGFITFIGAFKAWDYDDVGLPLDIIDDDTDRGKPKVGARHLVPTAFPDVVNRIPPTANVEPFILSLEVPLTVAEANNVLRYGATAPSQANIEQTDLVYAKEPRLAPGESVRIQYWHKGETSEDPGILEYFHVRSDAYISRFNRHSIVRKAGNREYRENIPNQYKTFVLDMALAQLKMDQPDQRARFISEIVPVKPAPEEGVLEILKAGKILSSADLYTATELASLRKGELQQVIRYYLTLIANPRNQLEVYLYGLRFNFDMNTLINWIISKRGIRHYRVNSIPDHQDKDQKTWNTEVIWMYDEAQTRADKKWNGYLKWFKEQEAKKPFKQRRQASKSDFYNEQLRRIVVAQTGERLYRLFNLAHHDLRTDSKSIADPTAAILPRNAFPELKTKSSKGGSKPSSRAGSRAGSRSNSRAGSPAVASSPAAAASSSAIIQPSGPVVDLSQFF